MVIATDADGPGDDAAAKLTPALRSFGARVERWRPMEAKDFNEVLQAQGAEALRRALFNDLASPRFTALWATIIGVCRKGGRPLPHTALEAAIDAADWPAFMREMRVYAALVGSLISEQEVA